MLASVGEQKASGKQNHLDFQERFDRFGYC